MDQEANALRSTEERMRTAAEMRLPELATEPPTSSVAGEAQWARSKAAESFTVHALGLSDVERHKILYEWNSTAAEFPRDLCVHEAFQEQVNKTPDAVALVLEGASLTYAELNRRANQLAHHLRGLGVKPDSRVALCLERSFEMVVSILAVVKAGGAYVPLDPAYPMDRLHAMLEDSEPVALLTQEHLTGLFHGVLQGLPVVDVSTNHPSWLSQPDTDLDRDGLLPTDLVYVIYTSGSTGKPKGVMVEHLSLINRLVWMQDAFQLNASDAVLQKTPFSFDVSVWEFFWPLMFGSRLVIARPEGHKDPQYLVDTISRHKITTIHFVPSMLQLFVEQVDAERCASLVRVIASGEALPVALARKFQDRLPDAGLHNLYGPTEATVDVTSWTYRPDPSLTSIPIGRPIANTRMYILDDRGAPVRVGDPGELFIGGVGVARGYLNRPELTAERFLRDPFSPEAGARMYKSGDLCRWLPDGNIEYLGRNDFQVKLRGFRIELGEIEARLAEQPTVREVVVIAREDLAGDKRLVAYLVLAAGAELREREMREALGRNLPDYMVPSSFVVLGRMPVTANGKLDRTALPAPRTVAQVRREAEASTLAAVGKVKASLNGTAAPVDRPASSREITYVPPRDTLEVQLIEIWETILGVPRIGIRDDFFELGGHSLLAAQMFAKISDKLHKKLPFATLFHGATIEKLAEVIRAEGWKSHWSVLVPIQEHGAKPPLFLVHGLHGNVLNFYGLRQHIPPDQPLYGVQANGLDSGRASFVSIPDMAAHYNREIRLVQPSGPYFLGGFSAGGLVAYEMARQLAEAGQHVQFLALFDSYVEAAGGYWLKSFYSKRALRMSLLALRASMHSVQKDGVVPVLGVKLRSMGMNIRIMMWQLMDRLLGRAKTKDKTQAIFLSPREAFTRAIRTYVPQPYAGSAVSFRSPSSDFEKPDFAEGWAKYISGKLEHHEIHGGHDDIFREPHIAGLADQLMQALQDSYVEQPETTRTI